MCPGRHGKKTDIRDLFWHFSIKVIRNALIGEPDDKTNSEKKSLLQTLHVWLKNVKTDQGYQFYLPINIQAHQRVQTVVNREAGKPG